ncbi:MAG: hypothetical protein M0Q95_21670, partial [Porticoccaceae bacterium]|nr:hypothetical protein [Porticoccaceae bacterium]
MHRLATGGHQWTAEATVEQFKPEEPYSQRATTPPDETDALGHTVLYGYDAGGQLQSRVLDTNGNGEIDGADQILASWQYRPDGKLIGRTDHLTGETASFSYDAQGRLQSAGNAAIGYSFGYDASGLLTQVSDSAGRSISYSYNGAGQKTQTSYSSGESIGYGYDGAGRLQSLASSAAGLFSFGYDARSRRSSLLYPNGVATGYSYAPERDWLAGILYQDSGGASLLEIGYPDHDLVGNRLQRSENGAATLYGYDALYRLSQAAGASTETYSWDPAGNRTSGPTGAESYSHDAAGRMSTGSQGGYGYDALGNQTSRTLPGGSWSLVWNGLGQLIGAQKTGTSITFTYDPFGRRIEKSLTDATGATVHTYVYDGEDIAFEITTSSGGTVTTHYVHGPGIDEPLAMVRDG